MRSKMSVGSGVEERVRLDNVHVASRDLQTSCGLSGLWET